jgi:hypothetical protein
VLWIGKKVDSVFRVDDNSVFVLDGVDLYGFVWVLWVKIGEKSVLNNVVDKIGFVLLAGIDDSGLPVVLMVDKGCLCLVIIGKINVLRGDPEEMGWFWADDKGKFGPDVEAGDPVEI